MSAVGRYSVARYATTRDYSGSMPFGNGLPRLQRVGPDCLLADLLFGR